MLGSLYTHKIFAPKSYFVLEIVYDTRTDYRLHLHEVNRYKKRYFVANTILENGDLEEIMETLESKKFVNILFRGVNIISEEINLDSNSILSTEEILKQSTFDHLDDYVISTKITEEKGYLEVIRKEIIENWVERLKSLKKEIGLIQIGTQSLNTLLSGYALPKGDYLLNSKPISWNGSNCQPSLRDANELIALEEVIEEDEEKRSDAISLHALGFITAEYFTKESQHLSNTKELKINTEGFYIQQFIRKTSTYFLPLLFIALMVNVFTFSNYTKQVSTLNNRLNTNEYKWNIYEDLMHKYESNKSLLSRHLNQGQFSYFADQLAFLRPYQVQFVKVDIKPLTEKGLEFKVKNNVIEIEGLSTNHSQYQAWLNLLEKRPWVSQLETISYKRNPQTKSTRFILKIHTAYE